MKDSWPKVSASVEYSISCTHSLPSIGVSDPHSHSYIVRAGWSHEINPDMGCTKSLSDMEKDVRPLLDQLNGANLNDVFDFPPTAEIMACWIMARLPAYWQFVEIECYGNYRVRIQADAMRSEWADRFRQ